jgi:hypothetical protein
MEAQPHRVDRRREQLRRDGIVEPGQVQACAVALLAALEYAAYSRL